MQKNILPYNKELFEEEFKQTLVFKKLENDFDFISFDNDFRISMHRNHYVEARLRYGRPKSYFSAVPFYYLDFLLKENPERIYNLGCGWNIFKKYISTNIIGVGTEDIHSGLFFGDEYSNINSDYIIKHQGFFKSVFSINSIHHYPMENIRNKVTEFASMIAKDGKGFITINLQRIMELSQDVRFKVVNLDFFEEWIRTELYNLPLDYDYEVFDLNFDPENINYFMDGNIRMIIKR